MHQKLNLKVQKLFINSKKISLHKTFLVVFLESSLFTYLLFRLLEDCLDIFVAKNV